METVSLFSTSTTEALLFFSPMNHVLKQTTQKFGTNLRSLKCFLHGPPTLKFLTPKYRSCGFVGPAETKNSFPKSAATIYRFRATGTESWNFHFRGFKFWQKLHFGGHQNGSWDCSCICTRPFHCYKCQKYTGFTAPNQPQPKIEQ